MSLGAHWALNLDGGGSSEMVVGGSIVNVPSDGRALWNSRTNGKATASLAMQGDGNLVLYGAAGQALWNSRTAGKTNAHLVVQDDGNAVLYSGTRAVWSTGTCCH